MVEKQVRAVKEIVTVSEMARAIGLSRARFYQLVKEGVLPEPARNPKTKRPFYDRQQQEQCLLIRRTNRGANGRAVLFYGRRSEGLALTKRPPATKKKPRRPNRKDSGSAKPETLIDELRHGLGQLGVAEVSAADIRSALAGEHPDGHGHVDRSELLLSVFRNLKRRDSNDNVAR